MIFAQKCGSKRSWSEIGRHNVNRGGNLKISCYASVAIPTPSSRFTRTGS
jgi:hypothetical protein